jgi:hypothetical protein
MTDFGKSQFDEEAAIRDAASEKLKKECREKNMSPGETGKAIFAQIPEEELKELARYLRYCNVWYRLANFTPLVIKPDGLSEVLAESGQAYVYQGYVEHPKAVKFLSDFKTKKTIREVFDLFLEAARISKEAFISSIAGLDVAHFETVLDEEWEKWCGIFDINQQKLQAQLEQNRLAEIKSNKRFEEAEANFKVLMQD